MSQGSFSRLLLMLVCFISLAATMVADQGQQPPQRPAASSSSSSASPSSQTNSNDPRGGGVKGQVVPNPGAQLMVELYENGARVDITTSDRDGNFLFLGRQTNQRYEIRIVLGADAEFRQEYEFSAGTPTFVSLNPRYIHSMHPDSKASGLAISLISLSAPKNAQKELEKARELEHKQKLEEALPHLQKAVEAYPQYAEAFNDMGLVHGLLGHAPEAATYYAKAAEADPKWTTPYLNLGQVQLTTGQFDALLKTSQKVEELNPKLETAFYFSGMAFANTKKLEEAERDGLTADQLANGKDPRVHLLLGVVFEARGKVKEAVERYQTYLKMNPGADNAAAVKANVDKLARSLPADKP